MNRPIGVFDSGIGGLSLLASLMRALPNETYLYLADNASVPYGSRPPEEIAALAGRCADYLLYGGAKCVVIACNTITGNCVETLRKVCPVPVFGVEPALKPARERYGSRIGVLATPATLHCPKFKKLLNRLGEENFTLFPSPDLARAVEENFLNNLAESVAPCLEGIHREDLSCLVLGCTHYVLAEKTIAQLSGLPTLHGNDGTVQNVRRTVQEEDALHGVFSSSARNAPSLTLAVTRAGSLPYYVNILQRIGLAPALRECSEIILA